MNSLSACRETQETKDEDIEFLDGDMISAIAARPDDFRQSHSGWCVARNFDICRQLRVLSHAHILLIAGIQRPAERARRPRAQKAVDTKAASL